MNISKILNMEDIYVYDGMNEVERNVKRVFDFLVAFVALVVFTKQWNN